MFVLAWSLCLVVMWGLGNDRIIEKGRLSLDLQSAGMGQI